MNLMSCRLALCLLVIGLSSCGSAPEDPAPRLLAAEYALLLKRPAVALAELERALADSEGTRALADTLLRLGNVHRLMGQSDHGFAVLDAWLPRLRDGLENFPAAEWWDSERDKLTRSVRGVQSLRDQLAPPPK